MPHSASTVERIRDLGPWFHNLHLPDGTQTAPAHELGDFPAWKWRRIAHALPEDLSGWTALDVGCNAGFYSFELARRGAAVTAIDSDARYLRQAQWAAREFELEESIEFRQQQVYDLARDDARYDLVLFLGVLYHLRYPLLGLDVVARKARRLLCLQSMTMPGKLVKKRTDGLSLGQRFMLLLPGWPKMAFIEHRLADDPTNWWAPNHACIEAMLRSCGMAVIERPADEFYLCEPGANRAAVVNTCQAEYAAALGLGDRATAAEAAVIASAARQSPDKTAAE